MPLILVWALATRSSKQEHPLILEEPEVWFWLILVNQRAYLMTGPQ